MKRIRSVLRGREGMTLVELIVSAGLLCLVIAVFSASLRPAAEISRRTQELNSAELIADDLLETVRSRVETATEYIKCYENGADITDRTGSSRGSAVEFGTSNAVELLTADGCAETAIMVGSRAAGTEAAVEKGYLLERYYDNSTGVFYSKNADGTPCARALAQTYAKGFYMGLRAGLYFELDESGRTVTATVTIFRDADMTDAVFSDSLLIDLRYDIPVKTGVTAQKQDACGHSPPPSLVVISRVNGKTVMTDEPSPIFLIQKNGAADSTCNRLALDFTNSQHSSISLYDREDPAMGVSLKLLEGDYCCPTGVSCADGEWKQRTFTFELRCADAVNTFPDTVSVDTINNGCDYTVTLRTIHACPASREGEGA